MYEYKDIRIKLFNLQRWNNKSPYYWFNITRTLIVQNTKISKVYNYTPLNIFLA